MISRIFLAFSLLLAACGNTPQACPENASGTTDIVGVTWYLRFIERVNDTEAEAPSDPLRYTLVLGADGSASMLVSCRRCGTNYDVCGSKIGFDEEVLCTEALCLPQQPLDTDYLKLLAPADTLLRTGPYLVLSSAQGKLWFTRSPNE
ncbi:MAG TPA: META domain-containing protein [Polyangia bacterium]|nr:META domain-containing protein [Polyangia bacterium]